MTPTQRSLAELRSLGYTAEIVEKWIPAKGGGFRKDLFGFVDIIAITRDRTMAVQSFGEAWSEHVKKLNDKRDMVALWLAECHRSLELWGWRRLAPRGKRPRYVRRRGIVYIGPFDSAEVYECPEVVPVTQRESGLPDLPT